LPMFARRYGVACSTCHTSPPRLNETGYKFRAAGFRMPEELGTKSDRPFKATDYMGFRLQPRYDVHRTSVGSESHTFQKANLFAAEAYIWYGPVSKYFSSNFKVTVFPVETNETELNERIEGNLRFNYGTADKFIDIRAGVPHPMEGFAGSEYYTIANTRPLIQEQGTANFNQDTFFAPINYHQAGVTMAYHHKRSTFRGVISSGMREDIDDEDHRIEGFGRKEPFTHSISGSDKAGPDFQLFFNQILHPDGGGVSVYYYHGQSFLPRMDLINQPAGAAVSPAARLESQLNAAVRTLSVRSRGDSSPLSQAVTAASDPVTINNVPLFENDFHRVAFYAGYPVKRANFLYGIQHGKDTIGTGGHFTSLGQFGEASVKVINDISAVGVRFDWFDPARNKPDNVITGITPYINVWLHSELRVTAELRHLNAKQGPLQPSRKDDVFQLRLYWVK
ncbi:MAG TPA: hypothetical protein VFV34_24840, partial [Blastocatellia bacterium]|nr:hypothetical protein [Blastocatellia bacterium]